MPTITANGIDIAYEFHGPENRPVVLLIMGLGLPRTAWPPRLIELLVGAGYRVLTFDNRDIGHSQLLDELKTPNLAVQAFKHMLHMKVKSPYQLNDMAADTKALLGALDVNGAHVVGVSMGGMIGQLLAIDAPEVVKSFVSVMSTTGNRRLPGPDPAVRRFIVKGPKDLSTDARIDYHRRLWPMIGSPGYRKTPEEFEAFLDRIFTHGMPPTGVLRQTLAIIAAPNRVPMLQTLRVPTLVVHGAEDPLVPVECGYDTAEAIRDAEMVVIEGMGHDLPDGLLDRIADLIVGHARVSDAEATAAA